MPRPARSPAPIWKPRAAHLKKLRDRLEEGLLESIPYTKLNGDKENRIPNTTNISFEFIEGEGCS